MVSPLQVHQWTVPRGRTDLHLEDYGKRVLSGGLGPRVSLGHRLHANVSDPGSLQDPQRAETVVSAEGNEKICLRPTGPSSQCGRVVIVTNVPGYVSSSPSWRLTTRATSILTTGIVSSLEESIRARWTFGSTLPTGTSTCTMTSHHRPRGSSTRYSTRTASAGKTRLVRLISSRDFPVTSRSFSKIEYFRHDQVRPITDINV